MSQGALVRAVIRGLLWGILLAVMVGLALVTLHSRKERTGKERAGGEEEPPVLSALTDFRLTNRDGRPISLHDLAGSTWVADFIFTRCGGPCPMMTQRLAALGERLPAGVRRVSFTVDPDYDSPEVLADYAARYDAPDSWLFLTGSREEIWQLSVAGFKLGVGAAPQEPAEGAPEAETPSAPSPGPPPDHPGPIFHSTRFVLVDALGRIRGYYDAFEQESLDRLVREARAVAGG